MLPAAGHWLLNKTEGINQVTLAPRGWESKLFPYHSVLTSSKD